MPYSSTCTTARNLRAVSVSGRFFLLRSMFSLFLIVGGATAHALDHGHAEQAHMPVTPPPAAPNTVKPTLAAQPDSAARSFVTTRPLWIELTPLQQKALAPLSSEWDRIELFRKKKWLEIGDKLPKMQPDEQTRFTERMQEWVKLTPEERRSARETYARTKKLNSDQKSAQWQKYQELSDEQKKKLANDVTIKKPVANLPFPKNSIKPASAASPVLAPPLERPVPPEPLNQPAITPTPPTQSATP